MELAEKQERYNVLVSRILTNKATVGKGLWEMGLDLKEVKEKELYLLEFRDFKTFLKKKVVLSERTAYRCIDITKEFDLRDFMKWGLYKLEIIKREFPAEFGKEKPQDRREFMGQATAELGKPIEPQVIDYKVSRGIKEITRFTDQIPTKPDLDTIEERKLRLKRQWTVIKAHCESLITVLKDELVTWITLAKKFEKDKEIVELITKAEQIYKKLR